MAGAINGGVRVDFPAWIRDAMARAPEVVRGVLARRLTEAQLLAQREVMERTPVGAFGAARQSIQAPPLEAAGGRLTATVGTPLVYALPLEEGSRPHMPPVAPLITWVRAKLGVGGDEGEKIAHAIAWKIKHHGTKGAWMFRDGFAAVETQVMRLLDGAAEEIAAKLGGV